MKLRRLSVAVGLASAATLAGASAASASPPVEPLGAHVSECAQVALGQREDPPTLTCTHDGHVHSFATFGELVAHLLEQRE
jgi:hypothetical protein